MGGDGLGVCVSLYWKFGTVCMKCGSPRYVVELENHLYRSVLFLLWGGWVCTGGLGPSVGGMG